MLISKIKEIIELECYNEDETYLISVLDNDSGFLLHKNHVLFITRNIEKLDNDSINTNLLSLKNNVYISSVDNNPSFSADYYNILSFNESNENPIFDTYVELCNAYVNSQKKMPFIDFFYALINLFQLPKEERYKNLIGLFGELLFIIMIYKEYGMDISDKWHLSGSMYDKYDFCFSTLNVEVKTTLKQEHIFLIKHQQIFNDNNNYIVVNNIEEDIAGNSLDELYTYFKTVSPFKDNLNFQIKLAEEKRKIESSQVKSKKYSIKLSTIYLNKDLETIKDIPNGLYDLQYQYDFTNRKSINIEDFITFVK